MEEMTWKQQKQRKKRAPAYDAGPINLTINGQAHDLHIGNRPGEIEPFHTLSFTLRETLGLTGTKISCDQGACGACTVIIDGKAVLSCKILTVECDGAAITTIEGLKNQKTGELDPFNRHSSIIRRFSAASAHQESL